MILSSPFLENNAHVAVWQGSNKGNHYSCVEQLPNGSASTSLERSLLGYCRETALDQNSAGAGVMGSK
jgi:hypothetical protein